MSDMNLFDLYGIKPVEKKEEKKKEKAAKPKGEKKEAKKYSVPVTVYCGFKEALVLDEDVFGAKEVTKKDIEKAVSNRIPEFAGNLLSLEVIKDSIMGASFNEARKIGKGKIYFTENTKMQFGCHVFDTAGIMTNQRCDVDTSELQEYIAKSVPEFGPAKDIKFYVGDDIVVPVPDFASRGTPKDFPVKVHILGRQSMEISKELYLKQLEEGKKEIKEESLKIESNVIADIVRKRYPEFDSQHMKLIYHKDTGYLVLWKSVGDSVKQKATLYPTDAVISLLFTKIQLSPEDFGGEEEVEEGDLILFLQKDYPEYSKERTEMLYDKKKNLIIPILKGSKKGAYLIQSEEEEQKLKDREYALYEKDIDGSRFRCENREEAFYCVEKKERNAIEKCIFKLPKIPYEVFYFAKEFFRDVCRIFDTEAALNIYWNKEKRKYFIECPIQWVSHTSVYLETDVDLAINEKYILIAQLHSHGNIRCSFSETDNRDEMATHYYGVFYGYEENNEPEFELRVSCGGYKAAVSYDDMFEEKKKVDIEMDFSDFYEKIHFM